MLEAIRTSRDSMVDQLLGHIITYLRRRGTFGGSGKEMRQLLFCRNVEYGRVCFEGFMKSGRSIQRLFWLKGMKTVLNGRTFKYQFGEDRFHMLPQSYKVSHGLCLNSFPQVWLISNQRYHVPLFRYINQSDEVSHLVR